ncbi:MAG TPA: cytochrome o ubiquinol oxidase subunit III [Candidatus Saccharimonadales bacterium]|nr:cytochrome o ubiquinol oxidase subunit III [Candidatus Saccharimonadales bacterium]
MAEHHNSEKNIFGFWVYLMTDLIMFAVLFATYAVLRNQTFGGPGPKEIFNLPYVLVETLILLTSSFTVGLSLLAAHKNSKTQALVWLGVTFLLGVAFLTLEISEFRQLILEGHSFQSSAFLSSYFALVGTHGLHIFAGLVWMGILVYKILVSGLSQGSVRKLTLLSLFWHFLDLVWIFIFTIVYLMGVI